MTARVALTYQDYAALPEDGKRYEIHDGELCVMTAPTSDHQIVSVRLLRVLDRHVEARGLGLVLYAPLDELTARVLDSGEHRLTTRVSGTEPVDLPPFVDLGLVPDSLWPPFPIQP